MQKMDGMIYAPQSKREKRVIDSGVFFFSVIGLDHGHIYAMTASLLAAGATLHSVYDPDREKVAAFTERFPQAAIAPSQDTILNDPTVHLVASAIVPYRCAALGLATLASDKHFFCDKPGALSRKEIDQIRDAITVSQKRYYIYYGARIHSEGALYVQELIHEGVLGDIVNITILAPHRINKAARPPWFFDPAKSGGIITDLGCHHTELFLTYTGATGAKVLDAATANFTNQEYPAFSDYGHFTLVTDSGATCHCRLDWFTPEGLSAWGDGRIFIVGTKASVEVRNYLDLARSGEGDQVYLVDSEGEHHIPVHGAVGFPFFGAMILDCINGTEEAIGQEHTLAAMELAIIAQEQAVRLTP